MAELMQLSFMNFIIVGLGTMFLIGEILVNMRGVFALLGIFLITTFFYINIPDPNMIIIMFIIYIIGLILIVIDGKVLNDGTLTVLGIGSMIASVSITAPNLTSGIYSVIGIIVGALLSLTFLKIFKPRKMWGKIALKDRLTTEAGYTTLTEEYKNLIGQSGITLTDMKPTGTVKINEKEYSAVSTGNLIKKDQKIKVINVDGTKIQVASND